MKKNKVLFISHYSDLYGSNMSMYSIVKYFKSKGVPVSVLFPQDGMLARMMQEDGISIHFFKIVHEACYVKFNKKYLVLPILWMYNLLAFPILLLKVKKINPNIIYSNSSCVILGGLIARILRIQHIQHVREFMDKDFGAYFLLGRSAKKRHLLNSYKVIYVSNAVANETTDGVQSNGKVIYNGVKDPKTVKNNYCFDGNLRLGIVGYIDKSKQQDLAIKYLARIVAKYPGITLHIVGDRKGPYKTYINSLVKRSSLENNVVFHGFIKGEDNIYDKFDVLLMCSKNEGFGRVTIEAMRRNIPVIGYNAAGTSELIQHKIDGFKFVNYEEFEDSIETILNFPDVVSEIITHAKNKSDSMFSEETYAENVYNFVFEDLED